MDIPKARPKPCQRGKRRETRTRVMAFNPSDAGWSQQGHSSTGAAEALPTEGVLIQTTEHSGEHC